jgi:hypothetical protein
LNHLGAAEHRHDRWTRRVRRECSSGCCVIPLHQGSDVYDLTTTVEPSWTYNFSVPMIAPYTPGVYGEMCGCPRGQTICPLYVYIEVK